MACVGQRAPCKPIDPHAADMRLGSEDGIHPIRYRLPGIPLDCSVLLNYRPGICINNQPVKVGGSPEVRTRSVDIDRTSWYTSVTRPDACRGIGLHGVTRWELT